MSYGIRTSWHKFVQHFTWAALSWKMVLFKRTQYASPVTTYYSLISRLYRNRLLLFYWNCNPQGDFSLLIPKVSEITHEDTHQPVGETST
jgi:hypothetical protein